MTEYGSADKEDQFPYLLKYSPYQNVKKGTAYPACFSLPGRATRGLIRCMRAR